MNKISVNYKEALDEGGKVINYSSILIDNEVLFDDYDVVLDLKQLTHSTEKEGEFFIFTCECGFHECAGIYDGIIVTHKNKIISWKTSAPFPELSFEFDKSNYINEIKSASKGLRM